MHFSDLSDHEKVLIALVVVLLPIVGMMVSNHYEELGIERDRAIERCKQTEDSKVCLEGIENRHSDCFSAASVGGGRYTPSSTNPKYYDYCVRHGVEALSLQKKVWNEERRAR